MSSKHSTKASFEWVSSMRLSNTVKGYWEIRTSRRSTFFHTLTSLSFAGLYGPRVPCQKEGICWHCLQLQTVTIALTVFSFSPTHFPMGYRDRLVLSLLFCCAFYGKLLLLPNKRAKLQGPSAVLSAGSFVIIIEMHYSHGHYKGQERWMLRPPRKHTFTYMLHQ